MEETGQPAPRAPGEISPDGEWVWTGGEWARATLSPDGRWVWDGTAWVPKPGLTTVAPAHKPKGPGLFGRKKARIAGKVEAKLAGRHEVVDGVAVSLFALSKLEPGLQQLRKGGSAFAQDVARMEAEISARQAALARDGYDSLYARALVQGGMPALTVPINLKKDEVVFFGVPARLARWRAHTSYEGGSRGLSVPIGNTRMRARVGRFSGHAISTQSLDVIDTGTVVLTSLRLLFLGHQKTVATDISKIIQLTPSANGISVSREGKESLDYYLCEGEEFNARYHAAAILADIPPESK